MAEQSVSLTILIENTRSREGLRVENGLSVWIETPGGAVLWDTGQGLSFLENARTMGLEIENASCVALSHGHYDHTGGLSAMLALNPCARVFGHPGLFIPRYCWTREQVRRIKPIGSPMGRESFYAQCRTFTLNSQPSEIIPGVYLTGEIPRKTTYEDTGGDFFLDLERAAPDPIADDQALYFETSRGIVVVLGCAHSGVVNILNHVAGITGKNRIYGVLGGMHLLDASEERLEETMKAFERFEVQVIAPCHCAGERAKSRFRALFPEKTVDCSTGMRFEFAL